MTADQPFVTIGISHGFSVKKMVTITNAFLEFIGTFQTQPEVVPVIAKFINRDDMLAMGAFSGVFLIIVDIAIRMSGA